MIFMLQDVPSYHLVPIHLVAREWAGNVLGIHDIWPRRVLILFLDAEP